MKCQVCHYGEATNHPLYGSLPCLSCRERRSHNRLPDHPVEMVGESIKYQRKAYAKSVVQPYRGGELSKEYLDLYGTKNIQATPKEIKKARYVWEDVHSRNIDLTKTK